MDILRELQQLLGQRVRVQSTMPELPVTGQLVDAEQEYFQLPDDRCLVVDTAGLEPETTALLRFLLQQFNHTADSPPRGLFERLVADEWADSTTFVSALSENAWDMQFPAILAVIRTGADRQHAIPELLAETLSDHPAVLITEDKMGRYWLYLPVAQGTLEDWKEAAVTWADTLLTELYIDVRIGISRLAETPPDLLRARQEADIALQAGSAFQHKQAVHNFGELGLAHILHGVATDAKAAFLEEVFPAEGNAVLTQDLRDTVLALAQHGQNIAETARSLFIHRNTLLYRLEKIQEVTGRDIRKFEDLLMLWLALTLQNEQTAQ